MIISLGGFEQAANSVDKKSKISTGTLIKSLETPKQVQISLSKITFKALSAVIACLNRNCNLTDTLIQKLLSRIPPSKK